MPEPRCIVTLSGWLERAGKHSALLHERLFFRAVEAGHVQLDELFTKVKLGSQRVWVWTAITARTKLIFAVHLGGRSIADACSLIHQVWQRLSPGCLPVFTSDGLNAYFYALTAHFGTWNKPPRARKAHWFPEPLLLYAQVRKLRHGYRIQFITSIIRLGIRDKIRTLLKDLGFTGRVQTAYIERSNLTLRELVAPLSRRTWSLAYDLYHLGLHIQVGLAYYHFVRPHQSLVVRVRGPSKHRLRTPAMAADLTNRRWSVIDILLMPLLEDAHFEPFPAA